MINIIFINIFFVHKKQCHKIYKTNINSYKASQIIILSNNKN